MAIDRIGVVRYAKLADVSRYGRHIDCRAEEDVAGASGALYLVWHALYGLPVNESWEVSLNWRRMKPYAAEWGEWESDWTRRCTLQTSSLGKRYFPGVEGVFFSHKLSEVMREAGISAESDVYKMAAGLYSQRGADAWQVAVHITANQQGDRKSPRSDEVLGIAFAPHFAPGEPVWLDPRTISIPYTADGWNRADDRWQLVQLSDAVGETAPYGIVESAGNGSGSITVDVGQLAKVPAHGTSVALDVRMNAAWNAPGQEWTHMHGPVGLKAGEVKDAEVSAVETPDRALSVTVSPTGDKGIEPSAWIVSLERDGDRHKADTAVVARRSDGSGSYMPSETVEFACPPRGAYTVAVAGYAKDSLGVGTVGEVAEFPMNTGRGAGIELRSADGARRIVAIWDAKLDEHQEPELEVVKFSGRRRPSALYGEGGTGGATLGLCVPMCPLNDGLGDPEEQVRAWRGLPEGGPMCLYRKDGTRMAVAAASVAVGMGAESVKATVDVELEEVEAW